MYSQNPRVRDAQNPYRTGVLIGNCWEDKFGMEMANTKVRITHPFANSIMMFRNKALLASVRTSPSSTSELQPLGMRTSRRQQR